MSRFVADKYLRKQHAPIESEALSAPPPRCLPEVRAVLDRTNEKFLALREHLLETTYEGRKHYTHLCPSVRGTKEDFIATAGDNDDDEERYCSDRSPYPGHNYFWEKIVPVMEVLAKTPEEFEQMGEDALRCLKLLMADSERCTTYGNLVRHFFDPLSPEEAESEYTYGKARGLFQYMHQKYGRMGAIAAAAFQGQQCDMHYDGGDYSWHTSALYKFFECVLAKLPPEIHQDALEAFVEYGGRFEARGFWNCLPDVVKAITDGGKAHMLPAFFKIAKAAPGVTPDDHPRSRNFPMVEPGPVLAELKAIDGMKKFKDEAVQFAIDVIKGGQRRYFEVRPTFRKSKEARYAGFGSGVVPLCVPDLLSKFKKAGYDDEKIKGILQLPAQIPSVGFSVAEHYPELEKHFPGGIEALTAYVQEMKDAPRCAIRLIDGIADGKYPKAGLDVFLETGKEVAKLLGEEAGSYFDTPMMGNKVFQLLAKSPDEFKTLVLEAATNAVESASQAGGGYEVYGIVFRLNSQSCVDPNRAQVLGGMNYILGKAKQQNDEHPLNDRDKYPRQMSLEEALKAYELAPATFTRTKRLKGRLVPADIDYETHAKIIAHHFLVEDRFGGSYHRYLSLVDKGLDYRLAACIGIADPRYGRDSDDLQYSVKLIEGIDPGIPAEKILPLLEQVMAVRKALIAVYNCSDDQLGWRRSQLEKLPQRDAVAKLGDLSVADLNVQLQVLDGLEGDPTLAKLVDLNALRAEVEAAKGLLFFKQVMNVAFVKKSLDLPREGLFVSGNSATRAAIATTALMAALGVENVPGLSERLEKLPIPPDAQMFDAALGQYESTLLSNLSVAIPAIERRIIGARTQMPGLMPEGAKVHTSGSMNAGVLRFLSKVFGLDSTPFHLIHADSSLNLPPLPSALDLKCLLKPLSYFGVIRREQDADLQSAMAGEWPKEVAAIVGAAMLLSTTIGGRYDKGAFSTTHDSLTGKRIMAYGGGVRYENLPFDRLKAKGRTDMLGLRDLEDLDRYRLLGSLASHYVYDGPFEDLFPVFAEKFQRILQRHGLLGHLYESAWVYDHRTPDDTEEHHEKMVDTFAKAWVKASGQIGFGIIQEVNALLHEMQGFVRNRKKQVIAAQPDEYGKLLSY